MAWGLGHLAIGDQRTARRLLVAEAALLILLAAITPALLDGTAYLVPFVMGAAFIAAWGAQAVAAYRAAQRLQPATGPATPHSAAAAIAWLGIPLLAWGTLFWLAAARNASPAAVLDGLLGRWDEVSSDANTVRREQLARDPAELTRDVREATAQLVSLCRDGRVEAECTAAPDRLLRDVRFRVVSAEPEEVIAVLELVQFERRDTTLLGFVRGATVVAIPTEPLLRVRLEALEGGRILGWPLGDRRWYIVDSSVPPLSPRD